MADAETERLTQKSEIRCFVGGMELMDQATIHAVEEWRHLGLDTHFPDGLEI